MEAQRETFEEAIDVVLADAEGFGVLGENEVVVTASIGKCGQCNNTMSLKKSEGRGQNRHLLW